METNLVSVMQSMFMFYICKSFVLNIFVFFVFVFRLAEGASESGKCLSKMVFRSSLEKEEFEQMIPKVSVKTTGAVIPLNKD